MAPFHLRFTLSRSERLANELTPWVPAIAGTLGFTIGLTVLAADASPWFLFLLLIPLALYRGLVALLLDVLMHSRQVVEISVDASDLRLQVGEKSSVLPLGGIIQVFPSGNSWTILHFGGEALTIPADVISEAQIEYLKSFARSAAAERKAAQAE